ncbi:NUMOD4 motif-containing HNH endonuclease [Pantoea sp. UBA5035]|uniref:NUMOD4 motif-containing HNH endonuclease n=1 Tax=Pantoea sp. UBA5035 TaxID=1947035 RepID=UPI00205C69A9|nr:NUMOD4 motif-containing HNH endonuclease [Pantoea sp. UBA5035]DAI68089.1 MAG TPA: homing endonuclease [Caudoviricetes sp.]
MMETEFGKFISGYEGKYSVTKDGRVYSHPRVNASGHARRGKWLKAVPDTKGYLRVGLFSNGGLKTRKVHRIVAETFIPNHYCKPEVNHINGDKADNRMENLEWCTGSENVRHAFRIGLKDAKGAANSRSKLTHEDVVAIRMASDMSLKELSDKYGVCQAQISDVRRGKSWRHI